MENQEIPFKVVGTYPVAQLTNGAVPIAWKKRDEESWYVLANTGHGPQPFAVWTCWTDGHCEWGHYFSEIVEAANYFHAAQKVGV
jgi:hypothetical protein